MVKSTFGPGGRTVVFNKGSESISTRDGVTAARQVELSDAFENEGAQLAREVCERTDRQAGDGTTTSLILTEELLHRGIKAITARIDPRAFAEGLQLALQGLEKNLSENSQPARYEDLGHIAHVASNQDKELAELVLQLFSDNSDAVIRIETKPGGSTEVEQIEGLEISGGFLIPYFLNNKDDREVKYSNPRILITDDAVSDISSLIPLLNQIADSREALCIITPGISNEVLSTLITNHQTNALPVVAIKAPGEGEEQKQWIEDLALLAGTEVFGKNKGQDLASAQLNQLGKVGIISCSAQKTFLLGLKDSELRKKMITRLARVASEAGKVTEKHEIEMRLARLRAHMKVLHVGGPSKLELEERKFRAEDAINAVRGALDEGVVLGGGLAYLQGLDHCRKIAAIKDLPKSTAVGVKAFCEALRSPFLQLVKNTGEEPLVWLDRVLAAETNFGFNAKPVSLKICGIPE
ncbi:MAG: chaperonin GroEL [Owenweeksia sp.]|nr:chaperonin GroEL [Owenweeksia sp.]